MLASSKNLEYECKLATLEIIYVWKCLTLSEAQAEELILAVDSEFFFYKNSRSDPRGGLFLFLLNLRLNWMSNSEPN